MKRVLTTLMIGAICAAAGALAEAQRGQAPAPPPLPLGALAPANLAKPRPKPPFDLTGVSSVSLACGWQAAPKNPLHFEAHLDAPDGKLLGKVSAMPMMEKKGPVQFAMLTIPIGAISDGSEHAVYFVYKGVENISGGVSSITFNAK